MGSKAVHAPNAGSTRLLVWGEGNKKRKEQGSLEKVVQKKTKMAEMVAQSSSSKDVTPVGLNLSQQLILELVAGNSLHLAHDPYDPQGGIVPGQSGLVGEGEEGVIFRGGGRRRRKSSRGDDAG